MMKFVSILFVVAVLLIAYGTSQSTQECLARNFTCPEITDRCPPFAKHRRMCRQSENKCSFSISKCGRFRRMY